MSNPKQTTNQIIENIYRIFLFLMFILPKKNQAFILKNKCHKKGIGIIGINFLIHVLRRVL